MPTNSLVKAELFEAKIISIGNELLNGKTSDTNSHFLVKELNNLGFSVTSTEVLPDVNETIKDKLTSLVLNDTPPALIFLTGGLGPTSDDLTRYALAEAFELKLIEDKDSKVKLEKRAEERKIRLANTNFRQALFPETATIVENKWGTANSFFIEVINQKNENLKTKIICLPGVPREMKALFEHQLIPIFKKDFPKLARKKYNYLRSFGIPESEVGERVEALDLPKELEIAYQPKFPDILITLSLSSKDLDPKLLEESKNKILNEFGEEHIYSKELHGSLPETLLELATQKNKTISLAESCTGGLIANKIVSVPGASKVFLGSAVTYSNHLKSSILKVKESTLQEKGAVSEETAREMVEGIQNITSSDIALSVTGIAGPGGGSDEKPAGTVFIGLLVNNETKVFELFFPYERDRFRQIVSHYSLNLLRKILLEA